MAPVLQRKDLGTRKRETVEPRLQRGKASHLSGNADAFAHSSNTDWSLPGHLWKHSEGDEKRTGCLTLQHGGGGGAKTKTSKQAIASTRARKFSRKPEPTGNRQKLTD